MKILLSRTPLSEINTFDDCEPHMVDIVDGYSGLTEFLSFKAHSLGYPNVGKLLERERFYYYIMPSEKKVDMKSLS